ncbi:hypothetical protein FQR65_LT05809 [Abscondita terminalis]|nr:hypothetical protein FQR65_LT05809 [Abscondita terminalis]
MNETAFAWYDYFLLIVMVAVSVGIGVYFGFFGKKQDTKKEYLLGGKNMQVFPIAVSLLASIISGITMLAYPADVYKYGSNLIWLCVTMPIICVIQAYVFLPIYFKLQITSMYEYLELRFDRKCRMLASFMYTVVMFFFNSIVIYIPSIAFAQATNVDIHYIAVFICVICIFYTGIGGLKAVVWTDAVQFIGMILSSVGVVVVGVNAVGGLEAVYNSSLNTQRLDIFEFDVTMRYNFWTIAFAGTTQWGSYMFFSQGSIQKCMALPNLNQARR